VVILVVTGLVLSALYRETVERAFDRRLHVYLKTIVADIAAPDDSSPREPQDLGEALFELPLSGWYWQVARLDGGEPVYVGSRSLWETRLPVLETARDGASGPAAPAVREAYVEGPENRRLRLVERSLDLGEDGRFLIAVAGDAGEIDAESAAFNRALAITFTLLGIGFVAAAFVQVRIGLAPLARLRDALAAVRAGGAERLDGRYPEEVAPLAHEMNALIEANRDVVERARTHVGNLAHALKTPLSVLVNESAGRDDPLAAKVNEQTDIMRAQVARHLERARIAARSPAFGTVTPVEPVVAALTRTLLRLHKGRDLLFDIEVAPAVRFRGERQDLEEMVGNLLDNACKWAAGRVVVAVTLAAGSGAEAGPMLRLVVDDDGPGLAAAEREAVLARGRRLDESKPGSGLGLSIVVEVARLYGGRLTLATAPSGGLRAVLTLPAA
jgi:signal transduction histidine kinase